VQTTSAARTHRGQRISPMLGIGITLCLLLAWTRSEEALANDLVALPLQPAGVAWPTEAWPRGELPAELDRPAFEAATAGLFEGVGRGGLRDTRALLIARGGRLVYERYAEGFGPESRFQSWSMAKSITQALVGVLVREGKLAVDAPAPVPEWQAPGDPRGAVLLDHLLHMTSGLANGDGFESGAEYVGEAMFGIGATSPAAFAATAEIDYPIGTHWAYSTGTSMIVAALSGRSMGGDARERLVFMRREPPKTGRASATSTCATACGMDAVSCPKAGSTTVARRRRRRTTASTVPTSGSTPSLARDSGRCTRALPPRPSPPRATASSWSSPCRPMICWSFGSASCRPRTSRSSGPTSGS